jgi:hypothetical protein
MGRRRDPGFSLDIQDTDDAALVTALHAGDGQAGKRELLRIPKDRPLSTCCRH